MTDWISVDARLPETDTKILMCGDGDQVEAGYYRGTSAYPWIFFEVGGYVECERCGDEISLDVSENGWRMKSVTHWMPLPDPPEEPQGEEK